MNHRRFISLLRLTTGEGTVLQFTNTSLDRTMFESVVRTEGISGMIRCLSIYESTFWHIDVISLKRNEFRLICPDFKNPSIVFSLADRIQYRQPGIPPGQIAGQQFHFAFIPNLDCTIVVDKGRMELFGISFDPAFLQALAPGNQILWEFMEHVGAGSPALVNAFPLEATAAQRNTIEDIINMKECGEFRKWFLQSRCMDLLRLSLQQVTPATLDHDPRVTEDGIEKVRAIYAWILNHMDAPHSLQGLAMRAGVNVSKLQITFKDLYGVSVMAFIRRERLQRAKKLLLESNKDIRTIASNAGYRGVPAFTAAFTAMFKVAPAHLRKGILK